jgi:hypothetical protein
MVRVEEAVGEGLVAGEGVAVEGEGLAGAGQVVEVAALARLSEPLFDGVTPAAEGIVAGSRSWRVRGALGGVGARGAFGHRAFLMIGGSLVRL